MRSAILPLTVLLALVGCADDPVPEVNFEQSRDSFELGDQKWWDFDSAYAYVSFLNTSGSDMRVTPVLFTGDGRELVNIPENMDYTPVEVEGHTTIEIYLDDDVGHWDDGSYTLFLEVEIGSFWNDPTDMSTMPTWTTETLNVPVNFTLDCDRDDDGFEDAACGGPDCYDEDPTIGEPSVEVCDGIDNDCDGLVDEDATDADTWYADTDDDGFGEEASEVTACDQPYGYVEDSTDCDDKDADVNPDAEEVCDGVDNNCDGTVDEDTSSDAEEWYIDDDGDGHGDASTTTTGCLQPRGYASTADDCDDSNELVSPDADEVCDGSDNNCDGEIDEDSATDASAWYADSDGDGFGDADSATLACSAPTDYVDNSTDCDDGDGDVNPDGEELCDDVDNDCDGDVDEDDASDASTWYADTDGDGFGDPDSTTAACEVPTGYTADSSDCDDGDASVSSTLTWHADTDGDGFGDADSTVDACTAPTDYVGDDTDCDDSSELVSPDADEVCDGADNNCDGEIDEDSATDASAWYADADGDGFGDADSTTLACSAPTDYVDGSTDCDDSDAEVSPEGEELCDGIDNNCDGEVDEAAASDAATWYADTDGDGYGDPDNTTAACEAPTGYTADSSDCDDTDGSVAGTVTWYADTDGDGYGDPDSTVGACTAPTGYVGDATDCDDTDDAVGGPSTWYADTDGDGFGDADSTAAACDMPTDYTDDATDCDDTDDTIGGPTTWYADTDGDGYGDAGATTDACVAPTDFVDNDADCDDGDDTISPDATESDDGIDQDCDELVDEDFVAEGDLIVVELMVDPTGSDAGYEWIDLYNASSRTIALDGWAWEVDDGTTAQTFALSADAGLTLAAGELLLLCADAATLEASASGVACDYSWGTDDGMTATAYGTAFNTDFALGNTEALVTVDLGGAAIDMVMYDSTWTITEGTSLTLDPGAFDSAANDDAGNWCSGSTDFDGANLGTPGTANDSCF